MADYTLEPITEGYSLEPIVPRRAVSSSMREATFGGQASEEEAPVFAGPPVERPSTQIPVRQPGMFETKALAPEQKPSVVRIRGALTKASEVFDETGRMIDEVAVGTVKDLPGAVARYGAGVLRAITLRGVDLESGRLTTPLTDTSVQVFPPLGKALAEIGASKEIANNQYVGIAGEVIGSVLPWSLISSGISKGINALRVARSGGQDLRALSAIERVGIQTAAGGALGAALAREPGENIVENMLTVAAAGAILTTAYEGGVAIAKLQGWGKANAYNLAKEELSKMFREGTAGGKAEPFSKAEADYAADFTLKKGMEARGEVPPTAEEFRDLAKRVRLARKARGEKPPAQPAAEPPIPGEPPPGEQKILPGEIPPEVKVAPIVPEPAPEITPQEINAALPTKAEYTAAKDLKLAELESIIETKPGGPEAAQIADLKKETYEDHIKSIEEVANVPISEGQQPARDLIEHQGADQLGALAAPGGGDIAGQGGEVIEAISKAEAITEGEPPTGAGGGRSVAEGGPLIEEARKYPSAEEFVSAKTNAYHGTDQEFEFFQGNDISLSPDKDLATKWAKIRAGGKGTPKVMPLFVSLENPYVTTNETGALQEFVKLQDKLPSMGYDGVIIKDEITGKVREMKAFSPGQIKTESQLADIWNKARGGKLTVHEETLAAFDQHLTEGDILPETHAAVKDIVDILKGHELEVPISFRKSSTHTPDGRKINFDLSNETDVAFLKDYGFTEERINDYRERKIPVRIYGEIEHFRDLGKGPEIRSKIILYDGAHPLDAYEELVHALQKRGIIFAGPAPEGVTQTAHEEAHAKQIVQDLLAGKEVLNVRKRPPVVSGRTAETGKEAGKAVEPDRQSSIRAAAKGRERGQLFSKTPAGHKVTPPARTYPEGQVKGNVWVRQAVTDSNADRQLMVQFSSDLINKDFGPDDASRYNDEVYGGKREGYDRLPDFWEIPQWMGFVSNYLPNADVYVVRDMAEAKKFLETAGYNRILFSSVDVNKNLIKELAKDFKGKVDIGGYTVPGTFDDLPNAKWHENLESLAKDLNIPYKQGVDYRHFEGSKVIPRLTMSQGCLHKCAMCTVPKQLIEASTELIDQQAEAFGELDAKLVYLNDKTFGQAKNYTHLENVYTAIKEKNPGFKGFIIQTTGTQFLKFDDAWLKRSGIKYVELGVETYNNAILKSMHKPHTEGILDRAVQKMRDNGIAFIPNVIIGYPGETRATYQRTLDFLDKNADVISHYNVNNLALYAGTELTKAVGGTKTKTDLDENQYQTRKSFHTEEQAQTGEEFAERVYAKGVKEKQFSIRDTFYSKLTKESESQDLPAKAQALIPYLLKKGVKPAELEWMGVDQWVKENQKDGRIDRDAFRTFLAANQIEMEEVTKADIKEGTAHPEIFETEEEARQWAERKAQGEEVGPTKFANWQIPGGTNYKEMLFTLPIQYNDAMEERFENTAREEYGRGYGAISAENQERVRRLALAGYPKTATGTYASTHWDEPNVVGHVRMNDRPNEILNLEEIQSDWHQEGKEKGYGGEIPPDWKIAKEGGMFVIRDPAGDVQGIGPTEEVARKEALELRQVKGAIPPAPFAENWHEVILKRMLRYAVDNGYTKLTWPAGEVQADRYDMSKQVQKIEVSYDEAENYIIDATLPDDSVRRIATGIPEDKLVNYVGKDLAAKIINNPDKSMFRGGDLKVGGEGMRVFYDEKLPGFLNKYLKQWGGKVEKGTLCAVPEGYEVTPRENAPEPVPVWEVKLTPAMQEGLQKPQALYSIRTPEFKKWFGESKVVDEEGKPLIVYHGTRSGKIDVFTEDPARDFGFHFGTKKQARSAGPLIPAYLSIKNPLRVDDVFVPDITGKWEIASELERLGIINREQMMAVIKNKSSQSMSKLLLEYIEKAGHDGLVYENKIEGQGDSYVALYPAQIKSAVSNRGTFDPNDSRINYSIRELGDLVRKAFKKNEIAKILIDAPKIQSGPLDGGCRVLARALKRIEPEGKVITLEGKHKEKWQPEHYGFEWEGAVIDGYGYAKDKDRWAKRFAKNENLTVPIRVVDREKDSDDILQDPPTEKLLADALIRQFSVRKEDDKINDPAPVVAKIKKGDRPESWAKIEQIAKKRGQFRYVTEEQQSVILAALAKAPTVSELAATAWAGRAARWWYADDGEFFKKTLGDDAYKFLGVMAATSPQAKAETENIRYGVTAWTDYVALRDKLGREPDAAEIDVLVEKMDIGMPMRKSGVARALKGEQLGGSEDVLKTRYYQNALFGSEMGAVLDIWHGRGMGQLKFTAAGEEIKIRQEFGDSIVYSVLADRMERAARTMDLPQSASQAAQWTIIKGIWDKMGDPKGKRKYLGIDALKALTNKDIALSGNYTTGIANYFKAEDPIIDKLVKIGIPREELAKLRPAWEKLEERGIDPNGKIYKTAPPEIKRELERLALRLEKARDTTDTLKIQEEHIKRKEPLLHVNLEVIHGPLAALPLARRKALHNEVRKKVLTDDRIKTIGTAFGVKVVDVVDGPGTWYNPTTKEVEQNPNFTPLLAIPPGDIKRQMTARIKGFAATLGFANRQEAIGFTHPVAREPLFELTGGPIIFADLGKTITFDQAEKLAAAIAELFPIDTAYLVPTKNGVLISMSKHDGKYPFSYEDFGDKAHNALDISIGKDVKRTQSFEKDVFEGGDYYEREGIYRENAEEIPSFESAIRDSGGPRGLNRVRLLLARIDEIKERYARIRPGKTAPVVPEVHERAGAVSLTGIHFSRAKRTILDPKFVGTGFQGAEKKRILSGTQNEPRLYFYANVGKGIEKEWLAPPHAHEAQLTNVYDIFEDVLKLVPKSKGSLNKFEISVMDAGYNGILDRTRGVVVMLGKQKIPVKYLGLQPDLKKIPTAPSLDISYSIRETPEFQKWFGKSKVVDENGKPRVVYHGTIHDIKNVFDPKMAGKSGIERTKSGRDLKYGIHFSDREWRAKMYAEELIGKKWRRGEVHAVYLAIENPLVFDHPKLDASDAALRHRRDIEWAASGNSPYDGVIVKGIDEETDYIVFRSTQIKSATGNIGTFDPANPDILKSIREVPETTEIPEYQLALEDLIKEEGYEGYAEFKQGEINDLLKQTEKILGDRRTQKIKTLIREHTGQTTGSVGNIIEMTEGKALGFALKKAAAAARTAYAAAKVEGEVKVIEARALGREAKREAVSEAVLKTAAHFMAIAERAKAKVALKKLIQGLIKTITKEPGPSVDFKYKEAIEALQAGIDPKMRQARTLERREATREYLRRHPDAEIPTKLMKLLEAKPLNEWTVKDLQALAAEIDTLRKQGTLKRKLKLAKLQHEHDRNVEAMVENILKGKPLERKAEPIIGATISEGKGRHVLKSGRAMTLQPARIFDKLDGGKDFRGKTHKLWYSEVNTAENKVLNGIDKRLNATETVIEGLKIKAKDLSKKTKILGTEFTRDEMLDIYAGWMNERKKLAMMMGNNISTEIYGEIEKALTPTDKSLVDHILKEYQDNYDRLRDAYIEFANDDMGIEENYTPMRRMDVTGDPLDQEIADEILLRRGLKKASLEKGFTVHRKNIPKEFQKPIRLGLLQTYMSQVPKQERFIVYAQKIRQLNKFLADKEFHAAVEQQYGREYIEELEKYVARVANPNIYKAMDGLSLLSQELRHNASIAYLAYNFLTMGNQIPSFFLSLADAGPYHLIASMMEFAKNPAKMIRMVKEKDPQVRHQSLERELEELKKNQSGLYAKIRAKVGDPGFKGIYWIDRIVRTTAWNAIYKRELDVGASETDAMATAGEAILRIQEGAHPKDISSLYATSEYLNWFLQFTSQLSKIYGNLTYDIPAQAREGMYGKAFLSVVGFFLSALGIWIVQNKRLPERKEEFADVVIDQVINAIPLVGKIISGAKSGFGDMTPPVLSGAKAITDAAFAKTEKIRNRKIVEGVAVGLGAPYVGTKRLLKTVAEGNPWEMIGPVKSREVQDRTRLMKNLETDLRKGTGKEDLQQAVKEKKITPEERTKLLQSSRLTEAVSKARKMKVGDLADEIRDASKADQRAMRPIFADKIQRAQKLDPKTRKEYLDILRGLGR